MMPEEVSATTRRLRHILRRSEPRAKTWNASFSMATPAAFVSGEVARFLHIPEPPSPWLVDIRGLLVWCLSFWLFYRVVPTSGFTRSEWLAVIGAAVLVFLIRAVVETGI